MVQGLGLPVLPTMFLGATVAAAVGAVLAIPAPRLDGLYLTLATLAFRPAGERLPQTWVSGGPPASRCPGHWSGRSTSPTTAPSSCSAW